MSFSINLSLVNSPTAFWQEVPIPFSNLNPRMIIQTPINSSNPQMQTNIAREIWGGCFNESTQGHEHDSQDTSSAVNVHMYNAYPNWAGILYGHWANRKAHHLNPVLLSLLKMLPENFREEEHKQNNQKKEEEMERASELRASFSNAIFIQYTSQIKPI